MTKTIRLFFLNATHSYIHMYVYTYIKVNLIQKTGEK